MYMKKILLIVYLLSIAAFVGYSQSLVLIDSVAGQLVNNATILKMGNTGTGEIIQHIAVKNNSASGLDVMAKKSYISVLPNTTNVFCWGICVGPDVFVSPDPIAIGPGSTNFLDFSGHYLPDTVTGITTIRYTFYVDGNVNDSVCFNVNFAAYPLGLEEINPKPALSNAFPNPANTDVNIDYVMPSGSRETSVIIRNVLGVVVNRQPITETSGKVTFSVNDLSNGIYFYSLVVNGEITLTKKMVVKH